MITANAITRVPPGPFIRSRWETSETADLDDLKAHPLCAIFPLMEGAEFDALVADIRTNGLIDPITLHRGLILDGRNRLRACRAARAVACFDVYEGDDPLRFVLSRNVARRHLNESQRAMVAARLMNTSHGGDRRSVGSGVRSRRDAGVISQSKAAALLNISVRSISSARALIKRADPQLTRAVDHGLLAVRLALRAAGLPPSSQSAIAAAAAAGGDAAIDMLKRLRREVRGLHVPRGLAFCVSRSDGPAGPALACHGVIASREQAEAAILILRDAVRQAWPDGEAAA